ncbi:MAG: hypothetical protein WKG00_16785 [Polyangiaceae bacterium]
MRAGVVDRLLARLDGAVAPIWVTLLVELDAPPDVAELRRAVRALVAETPRLRVAWLEPQGRWLEVPRSDAQIEAVVEVTPAPMPFAEAVRRALSTGVDLGGDVPLRMRLGPVTGGAAPWLLALQLHHALGDARAFGLLLERLFSHMHGEARGPGLGAPALTEQRALAEIARRLPLLVGAARPRRSLLARRGMSLGRDGADIGAQTVRTLRAPFGERQLPPGVSPSDVFFASMLAAVVATEVGADDDARVRLRVPVDLRQALGAPATLETPCSALAVEVPLGEARARLADPAALAALVRARVAEEMRAGVPWATLLEYLTLCRVVSRRSLRAGARPGLLDDPRAATLVLTHVGDLDRYFRRCPFAIRGMRGHTPTWGATSFTFRGVLSVNIAAFEGLWGERRHRAFAAEAATWMRQHLGIAAEVEG